MSAAFEALRATRGPCALLESTTSGPLARLSLLARRPLATLVATDTEARLDGPCGARTLAMGPFEALRHLLGLVPGGRWPDEGAVVAALAYDFGRPGRRRASTPLLLALAVERLELFAVEGPTRSQPASSTPEADTAGAEARTALTLEHGSPLGDPAQVERQSSFTRAAYRAAVARIQAHIARGDVYQANLSQRFQLPFPRSGLALYTHLRRVSPAPFSGYLRLAGIEIVSASPERLLFAEDGQLSTRPIAGTRPRAADAAADSALEVELLLSDKERAEHLMLVDLARNDLGRAAELGSVRVDELMVVENYAQVRHIVSNVRARLSPGRDALDALGALFPGGTITGVPKLRCMQILDAVEPVARGFYTGSMFYLTPSGRLDANILIRSGVVADGRLTFHAGGGIVADSEAEREYEETLYKAAGMRRAAELALADATDHS